MSSIKLSQAERAAGGEGEGGGGDGDGCHRGIWARFIETNQCSGESGEEEEEKVGVGGAGRGGSRKKSVRAVAGRNRSDERASREAGGGCPSCRRAPRGPPLLPPPGAPAAAAAAPQPPARAMEALNGPGPGPGDALRPPPPPSPGHHHPHAEKKRLHRAPSPARPFLKDLHARAAAKPPPAPPKSPGLPARAPPSPHPGAHQPSAGLLAAPGRLSRRPAAPGGKAAAAAVTAVGRAGAKAAPCAKRAARGPEPGPGGRGAGRQPGGEAAPPPGKGRKAKRGGAAGSGHAAAALARVGHTDSSSDLSDCPSEPLSDEQRLAPAASSDAESGTGSSDREREPPAAHPAAEPPRAGHGPGPGRGAPPALGSRGDALPAATGGGRASSVWEPPPAAPEELQREVEELRSENEYLKVSIARGARPRRGREGGGSGRSAAPSYLRMRGPRLGGGRVDSRCLESPPVGPPAPAGPNAKFYPRERNRGSENHPGASAPSSPAPTKRDRGTA